MIISAKDINKPVKFLYGTHGYGEGVLLSVDGTQARVRMTKYSLSPDTKMKTCNYETNVYAPYVELV